MLLALARKDFLSDNPTKRDEVYEKYKKHIIPEEEAEWYGLSLKEAIEKMKQMQSSAPIKRQPLKNRFREEFVEMLKTRENQVEEVPKEESSWFSSFKPFNKSS